MSKRNVAVAGLAALSLALSFPLTPALWAQCSSQAQKVSQTASFVETEGAPDGATLPRLSKEEVATVVEYLITQLDTQPLGELEVDPAVIEKETGIAVGPEHHNQVFPVFMAKLQGTSQGKASCSVSKTQAVAGAGCSSHASACSKACTAGAQQAKQVSLCSQYAACSLYGDLAGAQGEVLATYLLEKGEDGMTFEDLALPVFEAQDLRGQTVASSTLNGKPAVVVFLAGHCSHSFQTLPILQELQKTHASKDLQVVGVYLNSGTVEDIGTWIDAFAPEYDIWVHPDDSLGDVIESHLVPTYLLVDAQGQVREKLVGYKSLDEVEARLETLMRVGQSGKTQVGSAGF